MIGRESELAALDAAAAAVRAGGCGCVLVTGEAGVGKTRLVAEALARSALVAYGGASPATVAPPYEPITQILRVAVRRTPDLMGACGPYQPYLAALLPELGPGAPDVTVGTLVEALRHAVAAIAADGPIALVLDDLHWASDAMQLLLPQLATALRELPVLLVMAARDEVPDDTHRLRILRAQLRRICTPVELALGPLDRADTARLAAAVAGEELEPRDADVLYERTQGIPFYIEEMAGMLALQGSGEAGRLALPETILDAVLLRTDVLSRAAREALEIAAVAGASCEVAAVPGLRRDDPLAEVLAAGFLVEAAPGVVAFRHALVRDAIYHAIPWTRRQSLHAAQARALESASAPASERATHWLGAGDVDRARAALCDAAAASAGVHAHRDAARLYERALELGGGRDAERFDLLERLAVCAELAGDLATSARAWREVIDGRRGQGEVERVAEAQQTLGRVLALRGSVARALDAWLAAADGFRACGRGEDAARSWLDAASILHTTGSLRPALSAVQAAIKACPDDAPADLRARVRAVEGVVLGKLGETERALATVQAALSDALAAGAPAAAAVAYRALAGVYENAGDLARAGDAYEVAIDYCGMTGMTLTGRECSACLTHVLRQRGEWRRSLSLCRTLLDDPATDDVSRAVAAAVASQIHASRGDRRPARRRALEATPIVRQLRVFGAEVEALWTLARLELLEGSEEIALEHGAEILRRWEDSDDRHYGVNALGWAAALFADHDRHDELHRTVNALAVIAAENGNPETLATLSGALGEAARAAGTPGDAVAHFRRAADLFRDVELPHDRAEMLVSAAGAAIAAGDAEQARDWLHDARMIARRLGARPLQAAADRALAQLTTGPSEPAATAGLTARQLQVVRLVAEGRTNREIASELFLSVRTVDMHVRGALAALGCRSRLDAARRADELGLLTAPV